MKKIITLGATTLTALTLLGTVQPLVHAAQIGGRITKATSSLSQSQSKIVSQKIERAKLVNRQVKDATDKVTFADSAVETAVRANLKKQTGDITKGDLASMTGTLIVNAAITSSLEGLQFCTELTGFNSAFYEHGHNADFSALDSCTKLTSFIASNISQETFDSIDFKSFTSPKVLLGISKSHVYDLSRLNGTTIDHGGNVTQMTVAEASTEEHGARLTIPVRQIKNIDTSVAPVLSYRDGGRLENGNVVWDRIPSTTTQVSYTWAGVNGFAGTVTVPVTWASDEDKVQADVNLLFKDNTRTELNTGVTVQKIEAVRKEANALTDSAKKTELLGQIGDAYGMYFIVDAKTMTAGDPLGDKVKADASMKTLHDFVETATDFEADAVKTNTSKSAAGTYDYVRSGWSKAVASALSRVNSYVAGTDLSQAGLGNFSTDIANLNTAANAIQADQNDVSNDKVEVEYNYTAQAPGEPGWYGVVPSAVTLTDANRGTGEVANVELKNATQVGGNYVPYDGGKTVEVSVKSNNSYKLDDGKGDPNVDYKLNFVDGTGTHDVAQDAMEHKIGELKAGNTTIVSHIDLVGNATKSGRYVDNLFYHFSEK